MELTAAITIIGAVVAPFLIALITQPTWSADAKRNTAVGVSVALGVIVAIASGKITGIPDTVQVWTAHAIVSIGAVTALAQGFYLTLKTPVKALEAASSPTPSELATGN